MLIVLLLCCASSEYDLTIANCHAHSESLEAFMKDITFTRMPICCRRPTFLAELQNCIS